MQYAARNLVHISLHLRILYEPSTNLYHTWRLQDHRGCLQFVYEGGLEPESLLFLLREKSPPIPHYEEIESALDFTIPGIEI